MSLIVTTGSSFKSTNLPAAVFEAAVFLDNAEKTRNGANPGLAPKNNIQLTISSDEGIATITAVLPSEVSLDGTGSISYNAKDYLGGTYAAFTSGGDITVASAMDAFVVVAQKLSSAEKAVTPTEDQPNFIQIDSSSESGSITVTATLPYTGTILANGQLQVTMIDYL